MLVGRLVKTGSLPGDLLDVSSIVSWGTSGVTEQTITAPAVSAGDLLLMFRCYSGIDSTSPTNSTWTSLYTISGFPQEVYGKFADGDSTDDYTIPSSAPGHGMAQIAGFKVSGNTFGSQDTGGTFSGNSTDLFDYAGISAGAGSDESLTIHTSIKTGCNYTAVSPTPPVETIGFVNAGDSRGVAWGFTYDASSEAGVTQASWNPTGDTSAAALYGGARRLNIIST